MADTTTQTYVTREPDWMEAYRRGLIEDVKGVTSTASPIAEYQVAGMAPQQTQAAEMAGQGIGAYIPYLQQAGGYMGTGAGMMAAGTQAYNPQDVTQYMNPYQELVTQNAIQEMNRQAQIQRLVRWA